MLEKLLFVAGELRGATTLDRVSSDSKIEDDLASIKILREVTILGSRNFEVVFNGSKFEMRTAFSNQVINDEWMENANAIFQIVQEANK